MVNKTYNVLKGKLEPTSLNELYAFIKDFATSDSLHAIGLINAYLKFGMNVPKDENIPKTIVDWVNTNFKTESERLRLVLNTTRLARFLLLSKSNDYKKQWMDTQSPALLHGIGLVSQLYDKDIEPGNDSGHNAAMIMGRMAQWQFPLQTDKVDITGRGILLFIDIPLENPRTYNVDEKMKQYFGLNVFEFIASGLVLWMLSNAILSKGITIEAEELKDKIDNSCLDKFIELSSGTPTQYKKMLRGDNNWQSETNKLLDIYGLDPMIQMPAIKIERSMVINNSKDAYIIPQSTYLLQRASSGIFYLLAEEEKKLANTNNKPGANPFRNFFGDVIFRSYVRKQLELASDPHVFIDLDNGFVHSGQKPDFAIIENSICVLFEVKTGLLNVESRTLFQEESVRAELAKPKGTFEKAIKQLNTFEEQILNKTIKDERFNNVTSVIKIIVGYEDIFVANSLILPLLEEQEAGKSKNFQIATISDIEKIGAALYKKENFCSLMLEKVADDYLSRWAIYNYLKKHAYNPIIHNAYDRFWKNLIGQ